MKLKVLFLKKKYIYYTLAAAVVLIILIILMVNTKSSSTFGISSDSKIIKADFNGDGKEDILYIKVQDNKYLLQVNTNDKSLVLEPDKKMYITGNYSPYWPMRVTLHDITRDKIPEIFIQASNKTSPIQHIFIYNSDKFEDIFCSSNNTLGFIDSHNNKTPKIISGVIDSEKVQFKNYYFSKNKLESFTFDSQSTNNFMGSTTIQAFIAYVQSLPSSESEKPKDMFYPGLTGKDISVIGKLAADNNIYVFQDCFFKDTKWDKEGKPTELQWTLNFKGISITQNDVIKNYSIDVILKSDTSCPNNCFKISSLYLN